MQLPVNKVPINATKEVITNNANLQHLSKIQKSRPCDFFKKIKLVLKLISEQLYLFRIHYTQGGNSPIAFKLKGDR